MDGSNNRNRAAVSDSVVSPILGYTTSLDDIFQQAALRPHMNILMLRPSWSGMTMATITDNERMSLNCEIIDSCSFQNLVVTSLVWNWYELIR